MTRRNLYVFVMYCTWPALSACAAAESVAPDAPAQVESVKPPPPKAAVREEDGVKQASEANPQAPAEARPSAPIAQTTTRAAALRVEIRAESGQALSELSVDCSGACFMIEAAAEGGHAPYTFTWEDGSHDAKRQLCPTANTQVKLEARDTAQMTAEFTIEATRGSAQLELRVQGCTDVDEAAVKLCRAAPPATCNLGNGVVLPEDVTVDVPGGTVQYFALGAELPPGHYRLSYVDGCATFGGSPDDGLGVGWSVNGQATMPGVWGCYLTGPDGTAFAVAPGTAGTFVGPSSAADASSGAYMTYPECVEANCDVPPLDFDFPGGKLGVARDGGGVGSIDDLGGEAEGGKSPTFRLSRVDGCMG